jgi:hypothetical protein|tara:strand:- start:9 stop:203 length:195 start_codon:yes stop_codon:yes gene_type:complete
MNRKSIIDEGIFDKLGKKIKKLAVKGIVNLSPEYRKQYKAGLKAAKEANDIMDDLLKRNNIKFP